jgi:hypothetical protein
MLIGIISVVILTQIKCQYLLLDAGNGVAKYGPVKGGAFKSCPELEDGMHQC